MGHRAQGDERDVEGSSGVSRRGRVLRDDHRHHLLASGGSAQQELDPEGQLQRAGVGAQDAVACGADAH